MKASDARVQTMISETTVSDARVQTVKQTRETQAEERRKLRELMEEEKQDRKRKREAQVAALTNVPSAAGATSGTAGASGAASGSGTAPSGTGATPVAMDAVHAVRAAAAPAAAPSFELPAELAEYTGDPADRCAGCCSRDACRLDWWALVHASLVGAWWMSAAIWVAVFGARLLDVSGIRGFDITNDTMQVTGSGWVHRGCCCC